MNEKEKNEETYGLLERMARLPKRLIAVIGIASILFILLIAFILIFPKQSKTMRELSKKRDQMQEELRDLDIEKESLQELYSLSGSREYLIRYLRENQGYMFEGDIRIDLADPDAIIPTPDPASLRTHDDFTPTPLPASLPTPTPDAVQHDPDDEMSEEPSATPAASNDEDGDNGGD